MTEFLTAQVRVFAPDEFARPAGWPENVGIAALIGADEPEIFPVHQKETGSEILVRIGALAGRDLSNAAFFPPLIGHTECDLSFSAVARLRAEIESFLRKTPDAVEEAADFFVNFDFATDEGLNLSSLVRVGSSPDETVAIVTPHGSAELAGYVPLEPVRPNGSQFIWAVLWPSPSGELVLLSDPNDNPVRISHTDVLVREDGMGLAIRRSGLGTSGALPGYILLPPGCIGFDPPASGSQVVIVARGKHYLVTPVPAWIDRPVPDDVRAKDVAAPKRFRGFSAGLSGSLAAFICIAVVSSFLLLTDKPAGITSLAEPVQSLRAELFK